LIRRILEISQADLEMDLVGRSLIERLLAPTRIYVKSMLALAAKVPVKGFAHITGGGLTDNIPRVLPAGTAVALERDRWPRDPLFEWLQSQGQIADAEMYRTFNCGIGMVAIVSADDADQAEQLLAAQGESVYRIGRVIEGAGEVSID
jgi:phosphoribosylformylglycinamidine cyclo-ligase